MLPPGDKRRKAGIRTPSEQIKKHCHEGSVYTWLITFIIVVFVIGYNDVFMMLAELISTDSTVERC